jgi:hypothetical protein
METGNYAKDGNAYLAERLKSEISKYGMNNEI